MKSFAFASLICVIVLSGCHSREQPLATPHTAKAARINSTDGWKHLGNSPRNGHVSGCAYWYDNGGFGSNITAADCYDESGQVTDIYHAPDDHTDTLANEPTSTARALIQNYAQTHQRS